MFTIKYRTYSLARTQNTALDAPIHYDQNEQIHGPFEFVSQEQDKEGYIVVYAHREGGAPGMTFGPYCGHFNTDPNAQTSERLEQPPRPTLWVMNDQGATIAKYDL